MTLWHLARVVEVGAPCVVGANVTMDEVAAVVLCWAGESAKQRELGGLPGLYLVNGKYEKEEVVVHVHP